jgi:hypothetical protein
MYLTRSGLWNGSAGLLLALGVLAGAQAQTPPTPAPEAPAAQAPAAAPAPAPAAKSTNWRFAGVDWSGFLDGYYSFNDNHPSSSANHQTNDLYNFDDKTDQFDLEAAKITFNRDPAPVGVHADFLFGRTNELMHPGTTKYDPYTLEQAYVSAKPPKTHGAEIDFGQFVTSAGAEVIEAKDNWNYSRSVLFAWAIPYYHFGLRTSLPATKTWTAGVQLVNGWNNVVNNEGGPTAGLTSVYAKPKYTWSLNFYTGPEKAAGVGEYRNLIDTTVLVTPSSKFNAYINYDFGNNTTSASTSQGVTTPASSAHWQGVALAAREQFTGKDAFAGRWELFNDNEGFSTGTAQTVKEGTATLEHKWTDRFIARLEYRHDWSDQNFFHKGDNSLVNAQSTLTVGFIAVIAPKR